MTSPNAAIGTDSLVFPMGHYLGSLYPSEGAELDSYILRIGWETYKLSSYEQLAVWALAHGMPEVPEMAAWTRPAVEDAARAAGIPDADAVLAELIRKALVVEVMPGTSEAVDFARVCRLRSLLVGVGNTPDEPLLFGIGLANTKPVVTVPTSAYELWKWGPACDSLWHACQIFAWANQQITPNDPSQTDPSLILGLILGEVQILVSHGAAYLDKA